MPVRRRRDRRLDCAGEWEYDPSDITGYWPGAGQLGGGQGPCQYHDPDDTDD